MLTSVGSSLGSIYKEGLAGERAGGKRQGRSSEEQQRGRSEGPAEFSASQCRGLSGVLGSGRGRWRLGSAENHGGGERASRSSREWRNRVEVVQSSLQREEKKEGHLEKIELSVVRVSSREEKTRRFNGKKCGLYKGE